MASHTTLAAIAVSRAETGIPRPLVSGSLPERGIMTGYEHMPSMPDRAPHLEGDMLRTLALARSSDSVRKGHLEMRLARTPREINAAQALRYRVFYEEMSATPNAEMASLKRDFDRFDAFCDHLLVIDLNLIAAGADERAVVGCYRLLRRDVAEQYGGFYTAAEYDLDGLMKNTAPNTRFLELGRSCVLPAYRSKQTIELLWQGIMHYAAMHKLDVMFGCASFEGVDPSELALPLSYLHHYHLTPPPLRVRALADRHVDMNLLPKNRINVREAKRALPPVIKGYLRAGCTIGDGAVIDHQFGTTDVFILLDISQMTARYFSKFSPQPSE